jgi:sugar/nucleoside kinase (ribokinase family)
MTSQYDVLIPGSYYCDIIFTGLPQFPALGTEVFTRGLTVTVGGVMNSVVALRRLGVQVGWTGQVGTDFFSAFILQQAEREGVDTSLLERLDEPFQRVTVAMSYPHDRAFLTYVDPAPSSIALVRRVLDRVAFRHLHFTGLQTDPAAPALLAQVKARGVTISMDCQHRVSEISDPTVQAVLAQLDVFMPNRAEAKQLTGEDDVHAAAERFLALVPTVIIKDGGNGAHGWHNGHYHYQPAINVAAVDTTGAGDVFNAGFLAAWLRGQPFNAALRWGAISGGLSTRGHGGTATAPTLDELHAWLEQLSESGG